MKRIDYINTAKKNAKRVLKKSRLFLKSPSSYHNIEKFIWYMNNTATKLGMHNSYFDSPSGASSYSYSTAYDLYLLSKEFFKNDILRSYCSTKYFNINNRHIINVALSDGVSVLDNSISLKTGTWGETHKAICLYTKNGILCVMANDKVVFDNIFNVSNQILQGVYTTNNNNVAYYGFYNGAILCHNESNHFIPASTTKILTSLCVYNICDLDDIITIKQSDVVSGSGSKYLPNESFTVKEALKIMLMESSNTLANSLANKCGAMI